MAAGGALVQFADPHPPHQPDALQRIRWAAMEFLLKSQKRNRRKLIIEQMILLLLRILLVLLAAFLVARFVYGAGALRGATHVVIVDDSLSMFDRDFEPARSRSPTRPPSSRSRNSPSTPPRRPRRNTSASTCSAKWKARRSTRPASATNPSQELDAKFATKFRKPSLMHVRPLAALQRAGKCWATPRPARGKILHFVSDFRDRDWSAGADAESMLVEMNSIVEAGVNLSLIDVAARPQRQGQGRQPPQQRRPGRPQGGHPRRHRGRRRRVHRLDHELRPGEGEPIRRGVHQRREGPDARRDARGPRAGQGQGAQVLAPLPAPGQGRHGDHREGHPRGARAQAPPRARAVQHPRHGDEEGQGRRQRGRRQHPRHGHRTPPQDPHPHRGRQQAGAARQRQRPVPHALFLHRQRHLRGRGRRLADLEKADLDLYPASS